MGCGASTPAATRPAPLAEEEEKKAREEAKGVVGQECHLPPEEDGEDAVEAAGAALAAMHEEEARAAEKEARRAERRRRRAEKEARRQAIEAERAEDEARKTAAAAAAARREMEEAEYGEAAVGEVAEEGEETEQFASYHPAYDEPGAEGWPPQQEQPLRQRTRAADAVAPTLSAQPDGFDNSRFRRAAGNKPGAVFSGLDSGHGGDILGALDATREAKVDAALGGGNGGSGGEDDIFDLGGGGGGGALAPPREAAAPQTVDSLGDFDESWMDAILADAGFDQ